MLRHRIRRTRALLAAVRYFTAEASAAAPSPSKTAAEDVSGGTATATAVKTDGRDTLGRRLLSLVYSKRSAAIAIRKWEEEGHTVRKYELNRLVRELRKLKRYKHALEVCEWMRTQGAIKLLPGDYAVHLDLIAKNRGLTSAEKFFEDLPDRMKGQPTCTALLHTYVHYKETSKAEALMAKMSECGFLKYALPYNHMLSLYISNNRLEKVPGIMEELKKNASPDIVTYNLLLTVCALQNDSITAEKVFLELKKAKLEPDWVTYSTLTSIYIKKSLHEEAASTLKEMEKRVHRRVRVAYPSMITLFTSLGNKNEAFRIWMKMKSTFRTMSNTEYTCMISSLIKLEELEEAENLYTEWESVSATGDIRIPNILLAAYINTNQMEMASKFCNRVVQKDMNASYTTWELLTWGYLKQNQMEKVLDCFKKAVGCVKKWNPDQRMVRDIFTVLQEHGDAEQAEQFLVAFRHAGHVNTEIYNLLLRTYEKAGKMPLIVAERMKKDNVELDEETLELIKITSKMCASEVSSCLS